MENHYGPMLRLLHSSMDQAVTAALESMELTSAQGHIMGYLAHCAQPPCPRDIESAFRLSHPTVSGLLQRLEKKGFIQLRTDPKDRRSKRIYRLPKADQCHEVIHRTIQENEKRLMEGFTPEEQALFAALLQRAMANLGYAPGTHFCKEEQGK